MLFCCCSFRDSSAVVSGVFGCCLQPRLGFVCEKVDRLDAAMPVLSVVAPQIVADELHDWSRKNAFVPVYSPVSCRFLFNI